MTNMQKVQWYGGDGATKALEFLTKKSYGGQSVKKEEKKMEISGQKVIDKKPKRKLGHRKVTPAHQSSKHRDSDGAASTSSAYPPNQQALTQKRPRALSSAVTKDSPQRKKGKYDDDTISGESMEDPQPQHLNKGKGKELASDIDYDMSTDPPYSTGSEEILAPNSDEVDDVEMSAEHPAVGSGLVRTDSDEDDDVVMSADQPAVGSGSVSPPP
jgi:hypothetical protein